ncbi:MAG: nucleotidyltransferase family protein, partial [Thermoguttaceae bacterium]
MGKNEIIAALKKYKQSTGDKYGIRSLGLFGSVVREESGPESDVDIVVK